MISGAAPVGRGGIAAARRNHAKNAGVLGIWARPGHFWGSEMGSETETGIGPRTGSEIGADWGRSGGQGRAWEFREIVGEEGVFGDPGRCRNASAKWVENRTGNGVGNRAGKLPKMGSDSGVGRQVERGRSKWRSARRRGFGGRKS